MRVFTASLATETNTFSPVPTDRASFVAGFYAGPGEHPDTPTLCSSPVPILRRRGRAEGFEVVEGTACWAEPAGLIQRETYEGLRDEILDQLRAALPVDGVVLGLHGAMVAQGYDDPEGDLLERVRALVGRDVVVAAEFDPHSHLTPRRVAQLDVLAAFLEFPHTDFFERGEHLVDLALRTIRGEIRPVISSFDCRMIDIFPTSREPMRGFVDRLKAMQGRDGILSISVIHGFMAGDVPEMGARIVVVTDGDAEAGQRLAERLGRALFALRGRTAMEVLGVEAGLDVVAASLRRERAAPLVVADIWDNPGGGVAGDGTHILRAMMARGMTSIGVAAIWDPVAVSFAHAAGVGGRIRLRFGGKCSDLSGEPIDAEVEVRAVAEDGWQSFRESRVALGRTAVVRLAGTEIDVVLIASRSQTYEPDIFSNLGIDPAGKDVLLVKSTNHFHAGFAPLAAAIVYVSAPSTYPTEPARTRYRKLNRTIWPQVEDPFAAAS
ncbi:M81 family metallopeptidase [Mangrovibrevibacter kandeliae]|uniref:M81 family metallopeptidase n=1 Tax=Mangrovibrevibacter kandeliae TaxID=2968473 RepID=UPI002118EC92|nr:M81 family metallopeptidase [Aurantimonas sp. CSK15Z-1]MCQ8783737.1 M81 family metallopeptidase [Aurantimonas sp. CSK15Z-1]